ncbi:MULTISPECIES: lipase chaperone [unclassified Nocardia]|uniref:lipase chaperone n=1 Tax=unclassified Nocardia TaxID=2637762 RepID=UPI00278BE934|nr:MULTISPECIES: lipase chaperone [unclassified Nocardia]
MTDYVLTASRFDQVLTRYDNGAPKDVIKHRRGALVTGLSDSEVDRLLRAGAIRPAPVDSIVDGPVAVIEPDTGGVGEQQGEATPAAAAPVGEVERPKQAAPKDAWIAFAVVRGMAEADAEAMSKTELIAALS